jgi:hypothetical protein
MAMRWFIRATGIIVAIGDKWKEAADKPPLSLLRNDARKPSAMRHLARLLSTTAVVALSATHAVDARTHHRALRATAPAAATKSDTKIPVELKRDPADVALDRKIKGICKGC